MNIIEREMMLGMINILNQASQAYQNGNPIMTDDQFNARLADLQELEKETGVIYSNSPSINMDIKMLSEHIEVVHNHPMFGFKKCYSPEDIIKFSNDKELVASIKLDGMTVSLSYDNGILIRSELKGNGVSGLDITEHTKRFLNVPLKINKEGTYIVDGEAIIVDEDFAEINKNNGFINSKNLVNDTLNSLNISVVSHRKIRFMVWDVIDGGESNSLANNLNEAASLGFDVIPYWSIVHLDPKKLKGTLDYIFDYATDDGYPIDGIVFKFDDIEYGKSLGVTNQCLKNGIVYKTENVK